MTILIMILLVTLFLTTLHITTLIIMPLHITTFITMTLLIMTLLTWIYSGNKSFIIISKVFISIFIVFNEIYDNLSAYQFYNCQTSNFFSSETVSVLKYNFLICPIFNGYGLFFLHQQWLHSGILVFMEPRHSADWDST
jgi:hypothetical protein